ncbi:unnamed protein product, partial [Iphiclides podalirius]
MTRSKKVSEEGGATTLAILKNVRAEAAEAEAARAADEAKENARASPPAAHAPRAPHAPHAAPPAPRQYAAGRGGAPLPCAQYKTDKGYRCPNCQRCYNARKNLVRHVTLECGREPQYKCPHCTYSKHRRNELKKHIEKKHPAAAAPK